MIQEIQPRKFYNEYRPGLQPQPGDFVMHFCGRDILIRTGNGEPWLTWEQLQRCRGAAELEEAVEPGGTAEAANVIYLFAIDKIRYFLSLEDEIPAAGFEYKDVRKVRNENRLEGYQVFAAFTALHLDGWYRSGRYCGSCGGRTEHDENERALRCRDCGKKIYPRINPAVIVAVTNGDKLLLTYYAKNRGVQKIPALIAGFTEIGETFEECVAREVMEEVGLKVKNIRYYKSQPWGLAGDILAGYYCDVDGDDKLHIDEKELRMAEWVRREEIAGQPNPGSMTHEMMVRFRDGLPC